MSSTGGKANRVTVFVLNALFFVMGIFVILAYSAQPFLSVSLDVKFSQEQIADLLPMDQYPDIDPTSVIPEEGLTVKDLKIEIPSDMLFTTSIALTRQTFKGEPADMTASVEEVISTPINSLVDSLQSTLRVVIVEIAKEVAIQEARNALVEAIKLGSTKSAEEIKAILIEEGYDDGYFEEELSGLVEMLESPDGKVKVDEFTDEVVAMLGRCVEHVNSNEEIEDEDIKTVQWENVDTDVLSDSIAEGLVEYADEEGVIDIDDAIASALLTILGMAESSEEPDSQEPAAWKTTDPIVMSDSSSSDELKSTIKEKVMENLPENVYGIVGSVIKISSWFLIFSILVWVYLLIKIVCKLFMKDNSVKIGVPILLGHLPGMIVLILDAMIFFIHHGALTNLLSAELAALLTETLSITLFSSGIWAAFAVAIMVIFSIPYCIARHNQKDQKLKIKKFR